MRLTKHCHAVIAAVTFKTTIKSFLSGDRTRASINWCAFKHHASKLLPWD